MTMMRLKKGAVHVLEDGTVLDNEQEVDLTDDQIRMIGDTFEDPGSFQARMQREQERREEDDKIAQEEADKRAEEDARIQKDLLERTQGKDLRSEQERAEAAERGEQVNPVN